MALTDAQFKAWLQSADCIRCVLVEAVARIAGTETPLYLASRNYVTSAADTPASTVYQACITGDAPFYETLSLDGSPAISWGDIELSNHGGVRDAWLDYVWANRGVQVFVGDPRWPRADFRLVFDGLTSDIASRAANVLNLVLVDKLQRLNNPMTEALLGGSTDNKDRLLPLTFGECHNVTPLLTNPTTLVYQFHNGAAERVIEVRDNGAPITTFTTSLASGTFTLTAAPVGAITASVQGAKPGGTYSANIGTLVQHIVQNFGPSASRLVAGDLDTAQLAAFVSAYPQAVGTYMDQRANVLQVCQELAASVGAQVVMTTLGKLRLVPLTLPAAGTPVAVTGQDFDAKTLKISERPAVASTCVLGYCKNWTVQASGLATGLPSNSASSFGTEYLTTTQTDSGTNTDYKLSTQPVAENTRLNVTSEAVTESTRRTNLRKTQRHVYEAKYRAHMLLTELGDAITLTHARFGLSGGKTGIVTRIGREWIRGRITLGVLA